MVRVSSPAKLRPWSELTAEMVMGVGSWVGEFAFTALSSLLQELPDDALGDEFRHGLARATGSVSLHAMVRSVPHRHAGVSVLGCAIAMVAVGGCAQGARR